VYGTVIMVHNGTSIVLTGWSTVSGFDLAWFSSLSSERLFIFGLYGAIYLFVVMFFTVPFSELSLVGLALELTWLTNHCPSVL